MPGVTGIGGIFFRARNPKVLAEWYRTHFGMKVEEEGHSVFLWPDGQTPDKPGSTIWSIFPEGTDYFGTGGQSFMINYRVDDLEALITDLRGAGVTVDERVEEYEYGKFGWCIDPEGNRIELWEPGSGA